MFKVNHKHISHFTKLTLNIFTPCSSVSIVNFEHVIPGWSVAIGKDCSETFIETKIN